MLQIVHMNITHNFNVVHCRFRNSGPMSLDNSEELDAIISIIVSLSNKLAFQHTHAIHINLYRSK